MRVILILTLTLVLAGCVRPERVRTVSQSALPVAQALADSVPALNARMVRQQRGFSERRAIDEADIAADAATVALYERSWHLRDDKNAAINSLAVLREGDAALLADPVPGQPTPTPVAPVVVPMSDITALQAGLANLVKPQKFELGDLLSYAEAIQKERAKQKQ